MCKQANTSTGGIFHDTAVHDIDLMCWILGEYPTCVATQASTLTPEIADIGDYDTVIITLQFPSGTLGIIDISRLSSHGYDQRVEVRFLSPLTILSVMFEHHSTCSWQSPSLCSLLSGYDLIFPW